MGVCGHCVVVATVVLVVVVAVVGPVVAVAVDGPAVVVVAVVVAMNCLMHFVHLCTTIGWWAQ